MNRLRLRIGFGIAAALALAGLAGTEAARGGWTAVLGGPLFEESFERQAPALMRAPLAPEKVADLAEACSAFVNTYRLSRDERYRRRAEEIADFLLASTSANGPPGWGPKLEKGYGFCPDEDNFTGRDLWETTRALDCVLKVSEIDRSNPRYVTAAREVVDRWPSIERRLAGEGPYAAKGMRFYSKSPETCARKYVKNTNIAMGESLFRLARATGEARYRERGGQVLNAELWEILTRKNFGYHGAMIYVEPSDPQNQQVLRDERKKVEVDADGNTVCRSRNPDPSCWNHLAFEAYELYQVQLLSREELARPIWNIMSLYRTSPLGDTQRFDWNGTATPTHITAYNCYLRDSGKAIYREECVRALEHRPHGSMIFYSLVPDVLMKEP